MPNMEIICPECNEPTYGGISPLTGIFRLSRPAREGECEVCHERPMAKRTWFERTWIKALGWTE